MQSEKMCVVLLFGGMSSEHEVSRVSVGNFVNNIDREKYEVLTVGITKDGRWLYTEATAAQMADGSWEELAGNMACVISPDRADHGMILFTPEGHVEKVHVDVVIPVLHGLWGEDGTVQGLLELAGPLQGKGLGTHIFSALSQEAGAAGFQCIRLACLEENLPGLAFWAGMGFEEEGRSTLLKGGRKVRKLVKRL